MYCYEGLLELYRLTRKKLQTAAIAHYQETCVTVTWLKFNQRCSG